MKKLLIILMALTLLAAAACSSKKTDEKVLRVGMECAYARITGLSPTIQTARED
jgi:ABC-type amino acid transport substrate-binding protein